MENFGLASGSEQHVFIKYEPEKKSSDHKNIDDIAIAFSHHHILIKYEPGKKKL